MTRNDQTVLAHMIAAEDAVWDARRQAIVTRGETLVPMSADEAIVLYGMALRHVVGRVPLFAE